MGVWRDWVKSAVRHYTDKFQQTDVLARAIPAWKTASELPAPQDFAKLADEGYRRNVIIHACVRVIARSHGSISLVVEKRDGAGAWNPVNGDNPLTQLLERPNREQSGKEFFEELATFYWCSGNSYIHKRRSALLGPPVELWNLRPDRTKIKAGSDGFVSQYRYHINPSKPKGEPIPVEDVAHMKMPDPLDDYYGLSPIAVLAATGDLDNNAIKYLRAFFENSGIPSGLIKLKTTVTKDKAEEYKQQWRDNYGGVTGWHDVAVMGGSVEYQELGKQPNQLNLQAIFGETETRICSTFGVPPIIIACWIGLLRSTYSNYKEAQRDLWTDTNRPFWSRTAEMLTDRVAREFGDDLRIAVDFSKVAALQEDIESRRTFGLEGWKSGLLMLNEARRYAGEPEIVGGDIVRQSLNEEYVPVKIQNEKRFAVHEEPKRLVPGEARDAIGVDEDSKEPEWKALHRAADAQYGKMRLAFMVAAGKVKRSIDLQELSDAIDQGVPAPVNLIKWDDIAGEYIKEKFTPLLEAIHGQAGRSTRLPENNAAEGPAEQRFDLPDSTSEDWAQWRVAELVRDVDEETKRAIRSIINRRFEGLSTFEAVKLIKSLVGLTEKQALAIERFFRNLLEEQGVPYAVAVERADKRAKKMLRKRAIMIARTEGIRAASAGQEAIWREAQKQGLLEDEQEQFWIVTPDNDACKICDPMHGVMAKIGQPFVHPTSGREYYAPPDPHPQCLTGDTLISPGGRITAASKRRYDGDLIVIKTANENFLTCTPNHPVLTRHGWVAAGLLKVGNNIIGGSERERESLVGMHDNEMPARIEDIANSLIGDSGVLPIPVPVSAPDFHGDGKGSKVAIIWTDSALRYRDEVAIREQLVQHQLIGADIRSVKTEALPCERNCDLFLDWYSSAPSARMGGGDLLLSLPGTHPRPLQPFSLGLSSGLDSSGDESTLNDAPVDAVSVLQRLCRSASEIQDDEIVEKRVVSFRGHVYNLETEHGYIIAHNVVVSNCRCARGLK